MLYEPSSLTTSEGTTTSGHVLLTKHFIWEPPHGDSCTHALFHRRKLGVWQSILFWAGMMRPEEDDLWIRLRVSEVLLDGRSI